MKTDVSNQAETAPTRQQKLLLVATNLYRSDITNIYYARFKRRGKQIPRSLKTTDRKIAQRRLDDLRRGVDRLNTQDGRKLPFAEYDDKGILAGGLAKQWIDVVSTEVEASTSDRYRENIKQLAKSFGPLSVASIGVGQVETWAVTRTKCSPNTFNKELEVLRRIFKRAVKHGLRLDDPTEDLKRREPDEDAILIPSHAEFETLIAQMRAHNGKKSANLAVLLAVSGCRKSEITGNKKYKKPPMLIRDINLDRRKFVVTKSKNHKSRTVPLFPAMEKFVRQLLAEFPQAMDSNQRIIPVNSAIKTMETACQKLGFPKYGHHTMRHVFVSNAIEKGIDFGTIAKWIGHSDGGILLAKTYGHLRNEHSETMALRMDGNLGISNAEPANNAESPPAAPV